MDAILQINWREVFVPSMGLLEVMLRGTIIYIVLFVLLRLLRRDTGEMGVADVLLTVLIADAAQNGMASEYKSVTEGIVLVATIGFWNYTLDWLSFHVPLLQKFIHPAPLPLIKNGKLLARNLRRELISKEELMSQLREAGVEKVEEVKQCCLEGDGRLSVVKMGKD